MKVELKEPFKFNLQLFAEGGDDSGHGGNDDPNNNPDDTGVDKTFNQKEVDDIIKKRLGKEKKTTQKALLEELGLESIDDLKTIVATKKKADDDEKSDLQKLKDEIGILTKDKNDASEKAKKTLKIADFKVKASTEGLDVKQIDAALKLADLSEVEVDENGTVTGIEEVIKATIEAYPFLKGTVNSDVGGGAGGNPGGDGGKGGNLSIGQRLAASRKKQGDSSKNIYFGG